MSFAYTIQADAETVQEFERFSVKRHKGHYDLAGAASDTEVDAMVALAVDLIGRVDQWIRTHPPDLRTADKK